MPNLVLLVVVAAALSGGAAVRAAARLRRRRPARPRAACRPRTPAAGRSPWCWWRGSRPGSGRRPVRPRCAVLGLRGRLVLHRHLRLRAQPGWCSVSPSASVPRSSQVIAVAVLWDVLLTPFVLPCGDEGLRPARRRPAGRGRAPDGRQRVRAEHRLRLIVIQALVLSLFVTLFARLYYLQVVGGDGYQAQAADQSVRDIVVQPQRGLVVDAMGRPLVANRLLVGGLGRPQRARPSWRTTSATQLVERVARGDRARDRPTVEAPAPGLRRPGRGRRYLLERLALPAGAGRHRRRPGGRAAGARAAGGLPRRAGRAAERARLPAPVRRQPRPRARLPEPDHRGRVRPGPARPTTAASTVPPWSAAPAWRSSTTRGCVACPASARVAVDSMGRVLGDDSARWRRPPATPWSPRSTPRCRAWSSASWPGRWPQRTQVDKVTGRPYEADSGAAVVMEARTGRIVAMASQPTYDPEVWVGGISEQELASGSTPRTAGTPLLSPRHPGAVRARLDVEAVHDGRRAARTATPPTATLPCSSGFQVGNRVFKNFESGAYGTIGFAKALEVSCNTFFYRIGYDYWQRLRLRRGRRRRPGPAGRGRQGVRLRQPTTGIDLPGEAPGPDRRPARGSAPTTSRRRTTTAGSPASRRTPTPPTSSTGSPGSSASRATPTAPATRSTSPSVRATPSSPRCSWPAAYAALGNGGTLYEPRIGKAIVSPDGNVLRRDPAEGAGAQVKASKQTLAFIDEALKGVSTGRHDGLEARAASRSTRCRSAPRPAPRRSTASRPPAGSPPTPRTTSW